MRVAYTALVSEVARILDRVQQGADESSGGPLAPGAVTGGALANLFGVAQVTGSQWIGNVAQGGSRSIGQFAGSG